MKIAPKTHSHIGAGETVKFVQAHAPQGSSLLDAGCGNGIVAKYLIECGYVVTAIDSHNDAVAEASKIGVQIEREDFLAYKSTKQFDIILFSRAFHHMHPLAYAVEQAKALLKQDGMLLIEDFAAELVDKKTASWFYGLKALLKSSGLEMTGRGPKLEEGCIPAQPMEHWQKHHFGKHGVAKSTEMLSALQTDFEITEKQRLPYLYRYFIDDVSAAQSQAILEWEAVLCESGGLEPVGLRIAARRKL